MSFCQNCGTKLANGAKFCSGCGAPQNNVSVPQNNTVSKQTKTKIVASQHFSGAWVNVAPFNDEKSRNLRTFLSNLPDKDIAFEDVLVFLNGGLFTNGPRCGFIVTPDRMIGIDKKNHYFNIKVADISNADWSPTFNLFTPASQHFLIWTASQLLDLTYGVLEFKTAQFCKELKAFAIARRN